MNEIKSSTPSWVAPVERSTSGELELIKERLERVEAEIACLKDEQATQVQIKNLQQENLTICKDLISKFENEIKGKVEQLKM